MATKENVGAIIANNILFYIKQNEITKDGFMNSIDKPNTKFSNFIYELKQGKTTLNVLVNIANSLNIDMKQLFELNENGDGQLDMANLIESRAKQFAKGTRLELPELLGETWLNLKNGERKVLGKQVFKEASASGYNGTIKPLEKKSNNHMEYEIL